MMARLEGFEPPAHGLEGRCSIRLSYRRKPQDGFPKDYRRTTESGPSSADSNRLYHYSKYVSTDFSPFAGAGRFSRTDPEIDRTGCFDIKYNIGAR